MCVQAWPKQWEYRPKHREAKAADWIAKDTLKWTIPKGAPSQYNPLIYTSNADVEQAELDCVDNGVCLKFTKNVRKFYRKLDHVVGACSGEETNYIYAEWHMSGAIHGRPISEKLLKQYGVKL